MKLGIAADMRFIDDGAVPRHLRPALAPPCEGGIDHTAFWHEARIVAPVKAEIGVPGADRVAEQCIVPAQRADERLGVRVKHQLVRIEAVAVPWVVRAMYSIGVD